MICDAEWSQTIKFYILTKQTFGPVLLWQWHHTRYQLLFLSRSSLCPPPSSRMRVARCVIRRGPDVQTWSRTVECCCQGWGWSEHHVSTVTPSHTGLSLVSWSWPWHLIGRCLTLRSVLTVALFGDTGATWCYVLCSLASARTLQSTDTRLDPVLTP